MAMSYDGLWGIGELAERAGVSVKTVRFYSDSGLLPEAGRSAGGHRRYDVGALERLRMIRSLRLMDLPLPVVRRVLEEENTPGRTGGALEDAVAGQLRALGSQVRALRWKEAALLSVRESPPAERADRLRLIAAVAVPPSTAPLARFWRAWLPPRMPAGSVTAFLDIAVPQPPEDPEPDQVLAFAGLNALVTGDCGGSAPPQPAAHRAADARASTVLYAGLAEAYELAGTEMRRGRQPGPGEALDGFVDAYASARIAADTPAFRRELLRQLAADPRIDRYWELTAELTGVPGDPPEPTPGSAHDWLVAALDAEAGTVQPA
ncbi:MerR family DNA-binding transcriptional regulator [Streptomyces sp. NPDC048301]|uniref:MerR family DNA-binding transcriptional regulator n=1 Tax=unclassified Streptomyces TaxID=2593676 RepID=UPI00342CDE9A